MTVSNYTSPVRPMILLVDDYADALPAWELFLRAEGFDILTASNGPDALALATSSLPDLVVLDLRLPDADGLAMISDLVRTTGVKVVAMSGMDEAVWGPTAMKNGAVGCLAKPVRLPKLQQMIEQAASNKH